MLSLLLGLGLGHAANAFSLASPYDRVDATVHAVSAEGHGTRDGQQSLHPQLDQLPDGRALEMGPVAATLAMLALVAAVFARARRRRIR